ncbi:MAG: hypothetical protein R6U86_10025 [Bacteroidales bacterium]
MTEGIETKRGEMNYIKVYAIRAIGCDKFIDMVEGNGSHMEKAMQVMSETLDDQDFIDDHIVYGFRFLEWAGELDSRGQEIFACDVEGNYIGFEG